MRISGVTIVRNGVKLGYPFVEAIRSILPMCFEVIVGVGDSDDGTRKKIEEIRDSRIKIFDTKWDMKNRSGGLVLSEQTNLALSRCGGDWIFYIQADETAFEKDYDKIGSAVAAADSRQDIEGLCFDYLHFYGSYFTVQAGRNWYAREVRLIRNFRSIKSYGDAQGFRKEGRKLKASSANGTIYHYGWARPPDAMMEKVKSFHELWHDDEWIKKNCPTNEARDYFTDLGNLKEYKGPHPSVMASRINRDSEAFIRQCRAEYLKHRPIGRMIRDFLRKFKIGQNTNFIPVE